MEQLVSIIITNYNYVQFLAEAIDSALNQTYARTEVVVVDDGSTDGSREIIGRYGERIISVLKENGGQGSAFNAGFAASHGDVICFLDSDDVFYQEKVSRVLAAWRERPDAGLVYHQLQLVDTQKRKLGKPWPRAVWNGDIREKVERSGGWWPKPATTGLSFTRSYLERIFPMPTEPYRTCADAYVGGLAPFLGQVAGIRAPLALYRVHGQSYSLRTRDTDGYQWRLNRVVTEFNTLKETLDNRLSMSVPILIADNVRYQQFRRATGAPVSVFKVIATAAKCPTLPLMMKWREVVRIALNR